MGKDSVMKHGILAGMLWILAADGMHWFIMPHRDAGVVRTILVALQVLASLGLGYWVYQSGRKKEQALRHGVVAGHGAPFD